MTETCIPPDELVERVAAAIHARFVALQPRPDDWPTWGELLAQGHQGMHRVSDTRELARAALSVVPPRVVTDEMVEKALDVWYDDDGRWKLPSVLPHVPDDDGFAGRARSEMRAALEAALGVGR